MAKSFPVYETVRGLSGAKLAKSVDACRRRIGQRLRKLPRPKDMIPAEKMAARAVLAKCKGCGMCERAL